MEMIYNSENLELMQNGNNSELICNIFIIKNSLNEAVSNFQDH